MVFGWGFVGLGWGFVGLGWGFVGLGLGLVVGFLVGFLVGSTSNDMHVMCEESVTNFLAGSSRY